MIDRLYKTDHDFSTTLTAQWAVRYCAAGEQKSKSVLFAGIKISIRSCDKLIDIFNEEWCFPLMCRIDSAMSTKNVC